MKPVAGTKIEFRIDRSKWSSVREFMRNKLMELYDVFRRKGIYLGTAGTVIDEMNATLTIPVSHVDPTNDEFQKLYRQAESDIGVGLSALPAVLLSPLVVKAVALSVAGLSLALLTRNLGIAGARVISSTGTVFTQAKSLLSTPVIVGTLAAIFMLSGGLRLFRRR